MALGSVCSLQKRRISELWRKREIAHFREQTQNVGRGVPGRIQLGHAAFVSERMLVGDPAAQPGLGDRYA